MIMRASNTHYSGLGSRNFFSVLTYLILLFCEGSRLCRFWQKFLLASEEKSPQEESELQGGSQEPLLKTNELLVGKPGQKFRVLFKKGPFGKSSHFFWFVARFKIIFKKRGNGPG